MAKKKKPQALPPKVFDRSPFNSLTGFAVSDPELPKKVESSVSEPMQPTELLGSFAEEMALLEVQRLPAFAAEEDELLESQPPQMQQPQVPAAHSDEEVFLEALGELDVRFSDQFPDEEPPPAASARRMRQLKQGKLTPNASLDLHGLPRTAVAEKLRFFIQDAQYQGWSTLLVITGKGLHSESGEAVLRHETERFLAGDGRQTVIEWGRAPKEYGGDGALVLFLRKGQG